MLPPSLGAINKGVTLSPSLRRRTYVLWCVIFNMVAVFGRKHFFYIPKDISRSIFIKPGATL